MSRWKEEFDKHNIHKALDDVLGLLSVELKEPTEDEIVEWRRLKKVLDCFRDTIKEIDSEIISINDLTNIESPISSNILNELTAFKDNRALAHLQRANDQMTELMPQLAGLRTSSSIVSSSAESKKLEEQFDELGGSLIRKRDELMHSFTFLETRTANSREALRELNRLFNEYDGKTRASLSEWQKQFSEAQEKRINEFSDLRGKLEGETRDSLKEAVIDLGSFSTAEKEKFLSYTQAIIDDAKEKQSAIRELHHLSAVDSVSGGYESNANKEGKAADIWRRISMGSISSAAVWLLYVFFSNQDLFDWQILIFSFPVTGILLWGAAYCAQQSTKHRGVAVQNRRFALEMAAIDPYLQSLNKEDQLTIKRELTQNFFGHPHNSDNASTLDEHAVKNSLKLIGDQILKPVAELTKHFK